MAQIVYSRTTLFGALAADAINNLIRLKADIARIKAVMDSITGGGVTPANLEGGVYFGVATGQGSAYYTALANLNANLNTITTASLADIDMDG